MINALFAVDHYGGMGVNGTLPWPHNSEDLANFKQLTLDQVVVMGRDTWDDPKMPKPLKGRTVYVATHRPLYNAATISGNIKAEILRLEQQHADKTIWVIGGAKLLEQCDGIFDRLYLTHFTGSYKIDTKINLKTFLSGWSPVKATAPSNNSCTFVVYENLFARTIRSTE
jgi:dihydrofolate reductase